MRFTVSSIAQRAATSVLFTLILAACSDNKATSTAPATAIATKIVNKSGDTPIMAPVGTSLVSAASVQVLDQNGNPMPGVTVTWTAYDGSSVPVPNSLTDANGIAMADWSLGTIAGVDSLQASVGTTLSTYFVGTAQPGPVAKLIEVSGDQQQIAEGGTVQLVVQAVDQYGNAVPNASVVWVDESGGALSGTATTTDANGLATATLTADLAAEQYLVMAEVGSVAVTFTDVSN